VNLLRAGGTPIEVIDTSGTVDRSPLRYHLSRAQSHLRAILAVRRHRARPATVYLAGAGGGGLWYQLAVVVVARLAGCLIVFHHHNYSCVQRPRVALRLLIRAGGPRLRHVVLSERMGRELSRTYAAARDVLVCSNAGLLGPADPPSGKRPAGPLVLGHLSNLSVEKGLATVLATVRRLRGTGFPVRLLLAGPASGEEPAALVRSAEAEFGDALTYLGPIAAGDVDTFYRQLDVFLFPSTYRHEAEPLVVLEAARIGVPTVAFDIGTIRSLVADPSLLVPQGSDFGAAVERLVHGLGEPGARAEVRQRTVAVFDSRRRAALASYAQLTRMMTSMDGELHGGRPI
jgi:glycosyltransferase involved in cell wall biosynthesis